MKASQNLRKNGRKGFTLVELIIVIVIISILIAALTPAIMGVIKRANVAADEADARTVMMAGSVAGVVKQGVPDADQVRAELTGSGNVRAGTYDVYFSGPVAIGCEFRLGFRSEEAQSVGDTSGSSPVVVVIGSTGG